MGSSETALTRPRAAAGRGSGTASGVRLRRVGRRAVEAALMGTLLAQAVRGPWSLVSNGVARGGLSDWIAFAAAARMVSGHAGSAMYGFAAIHAAELRYLGLTSSPLTIPFLNPPAAAGLVIPIAALPPAAGITVFTAAGLLALVVAFALLRQLGCPSFPTLLALGSLPAGLALAVGQWTPLLVLALAAALRLLRPRPVAAGLLLAGLLIKPQYAWLVPIALVASRRWRVLGGSVAGVALLGALSLAAAGISGCVAWTHAVIDTGNHAIGVLIGVSGLFADLGLPSVGNAVTIGAIPACALGAYHWRERLREQPELAVAGSVGLSLLFAPHVLRADLLMAAPGLALAARTRPRVAALTAALLSVAFVNDFTDSASDMPAAFVVLTLAASVPLWALLRRSREDDPVAPSAASALAATIRRAGGRRTGARSHP
jgi:hypothetical protein